MRKTALLSVLLVLFAVPAIAAPPNYAVAKIGAYFPQSSDLDGFDTGFNGEIAFGHYFNPNMALEVSLGYLTSSGNESVSVPGVGVIGTSGDITSIPLLVSFKGAYPLPGGEVYALAGGGLYFTEAEISTPVGSQSDDDVAFGFQLGIGGSFNLASNIFLGLEGKYFWAAPSFNLFGTSQDVSIDGFQLTANVGFRF